MHISYLEIVDWEPAAISFGFSGLTPVEANAFVSFVDHWLQSSNRRAYCRCLYSFANFKKNVKHKRIELDTEWLCRVCAAVLVNLLEIEFPKLRRVEIGFPFLEKDSGPPFIDVPSRIVRFEDGNSASVEPFRIGRRPVTTGDFLRFAETTGYITSAERLGATENFRDHAAIAGFSPRVRSATPVSCVSFEDAKAFCDYASLSLPTEAQWLAASVGEAKEIDINTSEELRLRLRPVTPAQIVSTDWDITASKSANGMIIIRRGPLHFIKADWKSPEEVAFHRRLIAPLDFDIMITFRVIEPVRPTNSTHQGDHESGRDEPGLEAKGT